MDTAPRQVADELLVLRCQDGEADALAELVTRWHGRLWRHALRMTARHEAAWEVVQEAWLAIVRGIGRLNDPASFRAWAFRIVTHKAADWLTHHSRRRARQRELADEPVVADPPHEQTEDVQAALRRLPKGQRAVLSLRYLEELTVAEIATVLSIPAGTVKSRLHHARNHLKRIWQVRRSRPD